ncbi:MAG: hypothetical protein KAW92_10780, partial [Candidatus Cloacimonetes bacterium]|nr:hypothetical protein [Candidatus Cloacimonadota bacterium]
MKQNRNNLVLVLTLLLACIVLMPGKGIAENCDFMAMLAKNGSLISDFNEADYFFQFQKYRSCAAYQEDGYGVNYYKNGENTIPFNYDDPLADPLSESNQTFFLVGEGDHSWYQHHGPSSGYYWNDSKYQSEHPSKPDYVWIPRPGDLTPVNFTHNDHGVSVDIGFDFVEFYGGQYSEMIINPNGWIGFGEDNYAFNNTPIPSEAEEAPLLAIFGFWDDLNPEIGGSGGGNVYYEYQSVENRMIVWFEQVEKYGYPDTKFDFQIILYLDEETTNNDDIKIQYHQVQGITHYGTVGIQNADGYDGLQVVYNGNYTSDDSYVEDELALLFSTNEYPEPLDIAQERITNNIINYDAVIVLGHDRDRAGVSSLAVGQHPYVFDYTDPQQNTTTYTFQHNGYHDYKNPMRQYCWDHDPDWFITHPLNWEILGNTIYDLDTVNDTEILFHYIMAHVIEAGGDVVAGMLAAFNETEIEDDQGNVYNIRRYFHEDWNENRINVTLSDGDALYVFRNTAFWH